MSGPDRATAASQGGEHSGSGRDDGRESAGTRQVRLRGCAPTPLADYLKALGVLRLVAEQGDPDATGWWEADDFVLASRLDAKGLQRFFLHEYRPSPVIAPWNGGSGFYPNDQKGGIEPISRGASPRFAPLREAVRCAQGILERDGLEQKPQGEAKTRLLSQLRSELPDEALDWFEAAVLLTDESPAYPPLLGTGGNDGRLEFTNNFLQRLVSLLDPDTGEPRDDAAGLLADALCSETRPGLRADAIGQFSPGQAGGANQTSGYRTEKAPNNPWDYVLALEGATMFAAAATRRLAASGRSELSYPFTVRPTGAGSGATDRTDDDNARAELWAPLWTQPASARELRALLSEGRATVRRRAAVDGLDFARAVASLGVDRGLSGFQRYSFLQRSGRAYFATPLNRVATRRNPAIDLVDDLERGQWLSRFRRLAGRPESPRRVASLGRRLDDAIFALALEREHPAPRVQALLAVLGDIQLHMATSPSARATCPPVPWLSSAWLLRAEEGDDPELTVAAALAGLHARAHATDGDDRPRSAMPMRAHLAPEQPGAAPQWDSEQRRAVTWSGKDLDSDLVATLERRLLDAARDDLPDRPLQPVRTAPLATVAEWLAGTLDSARIGSLLPGLSLVRLPARGSAGARRRDTPLPAAYRVLKPFFTTEEQLRRCGLLAADVRLPVPPDLVRRLATGDVSDRALAPAIRRLRVAGLPMPFRSLSAGTPDARRLLAALLVPVPDDELRDLYPQPPTDRSEDAT